MTRPMVTDAMLTDAEIEVLKEGHECYWSQHYLTDRERTLPWLPVIEQVALQAERWKKPMPDISEPNAAVIWALKASEEMGELSAALLGRAIGKEGRGDPLEECYQLMAVLLRVASALQEEAHRDA